VEVQDNQPNGFSPKVESLCELLGEEIPDKFDASRFVKAHSSSSPEALYHTLASIQEAVEDKDLPRNVLGFAEALLKECDRLFPVTGDRRREGTSPSALPEGQLGKTETNPEPALPPEPKEEPLFQSLSVPGAPDGTTAGHSPKPDEAATCGYGETGYGWVKLYRKLLRDPMFQNPKLSHFWDYCLLKAVYKPTRAVIGYQEVLLQPGQFIFGRKMAAAETGLSERTIRTCISFLIKTGKMTIKPTNKFSIITVVNWKTYQSQENENDRQPGQQATTYKEDKEYKEKRPPKNPSEISDEISALVSKLFPSLEEKKLFDRVREAISSTRKGGRVSDSVILGQLKAWEKYSVHQVLAGIRIYLEKEYHGEGKGERYLMGIIRNHRSRTETRQERSEPSGSAGYDRALQDYYEGRLKIRPTMMSGSQGGTS
jgi:hypothetical protein